ncbi:hypothetical protein [Pleionea sp. CnH1-48]|uniref:hypothetical protein n=1 Tax=Pleionea sp. CnH1-48 TaxID=2954494 RepID=UPI0020973316|nr:hypothetical protein [Pleionea sp. CnH1-48]MCO7225910.1 hypothetical protein [Pleionea sp. CnH1-48]
MKRIASVLTLTFIISGCASIDFNVDSEKDKEKGLVYYESKPYLLYLKTEKCETTVSVVSVPGTKKKMKFKTNMFGSSEHSAKFSNGIITEIGQTSDSKASELLTSIAGLKTAGVLSDPGQMKCDPVARMIPIKDGVLDVDDNVDIISKIINNP